MTPATRVIAFRGQLIDLHGRPDAIRCDNRPELTSQTFTDWRKEQDIEMRFIQPGKPDQNAYIERFTDLSYSESDMADTVRSD